jgi:hypothetical protein
MVRISGYGPGAGCAQSGSGNPTSATATPDSASLSRSATGTVVQLGPADGYDAGGVWHVVVLDKPNGDVVPNGEGDLTFTQDGAGNLSSPSVGLTLTRVTTTTAMTIAYKVTLVGDRTPCDLNLSGTGELHTTDNTFFARLIGIGSDCQVHTYWLTFTRNPV